MSNMPYTITDKSVVVFIDGKTHTVSNGDSRYGDVRNAIRNENFDLIPSLLDLKGKLISESNGGLYLLNGVVRSDRYTIPALLAGRIAKMFSEGFSIGPITAFLENLMENPSESSRNELYGFIEACNLPITADGHFLAYKIVTRDFKDIYTKTMDNSVGTIVQMNREAVDDDRNRTCSRGLHFCSEGYLGHYGSEHSDQVVIVKINPRDVVSIPTDYDNAKGRACQYEVVEAISWKDRITPWFTSEHSGSQSEIDFDETDSDGTTNDGIEWDEYLVELSLDTAYDIEYDEYFAGLDDDENDVPYFSLTSESIGNRWEAYDNTGKLWGTFESRQEARESIGCWDFIWDNKNKECISQKYNLPYPGWTPAVNQPVAGAKLNATIVAEIRGRLNSNDYTTLTELAKEYGVSDRTIRRIRDYESWVDVA